MVQSVQVPLAALSTHAEWITRARTLAFRNLMPSSVLYGYLHSCGIHNYTKQK